MNLRTSLLATLLVLGSFTTACVGVEHVDEEDEPQAAAPKVEVSVESGTVSVKDTKTTTTTTTTTTDPCADSKVKTACKHEQLVKGLL